MEVIYVVVGILIGYVVSSIIRRKHPVGFLRIDKSDPDGPYLFLELKKNVIQDLEIRSMRDEIGNLKNEIKELRKTEGD